MKDDTSSTSGLNSAINPVGGNSPLGSDTPKIDLTPSAEPANSFADNTMAGENTTVTSAFPQPISGSAPAPVKTEPAVTQNPTMPTDSVLTPTSPTPTDNNSGPQIVNSPHVPKKYGGGKVIATIFGVLMIVGAVAAGVTLVQRQQLRTGFAWDCSTYNFEVSSSGEVKVINGSTRNEPAQTADVYINGDKVATFNVPALTPGNAASIGQVSTPNGEFTWRVDGSLDCEDSGTTQSIRKVNICHVPPGNIANSQTIEVDGNAWDTGHNEHNSHSLDFLIDGTHTCPPVTPTVTPGVTSTLTPTVPQSTLTPTEPQSTLTPTNPPASTTASCSAVEAYDANWNKLTAQTLSQLEAGQTVYFTVSGTASSGTFTKARFTINGALQTETTSLKPGTTNVYYDQYQIPTGTTTFNVSAQINHSTLGWL